jgi:hypothetical protein
VATQLDTSLGVSDLAYVYNKKHLQESVAAASVLGMLFGFWLGKRSGDAGAVESSWLCSVFLLYQALSSLESTKSIFPKRRNENLPLLPLTH